MANLEVCKNTNFDEIQRLLHITHKLVLEHSEEILNVNTIDSASPSWTRSVLSHDQAIKWTQAEVLVYSGSVLCLVKLNGSEGAIERCQGQEEELKMSLPTKHCWGTMEKQSNSSEIFPRIHIIVDSSRDSE